MQNLSGEDKDRATMISYNRVAHASHLVEIYDIPPGTWRQALPDFPAKSRNCRLVKATHLS
jgi:hypothetical protein